MFTSVSDKWGKKGEERSQTKNIPPFSFLSDFKSTVRLEKKIKIDTIIHIIIYINTKNARNKTDAIYITEKKKKRKKIKVRD